MSWNDILDIFDDGSLWTALYDICRNPRPAISVHTTISDASKAQSADQSMLANSLAIPQAVASTAGVPHVISRGTSWRFLRLYNSTVSLDILTPANIFVADFVYQSRMLILSKNLNSDYKLLHISNKLSAVWMQMPLALRSCARSSTYRPILDDPLLRFDASYRKISTAYRLLMRRVRGN